LNPPGTEALNPPMNAENPGEKVGDVGNMPFRKIFPADLS
jgi:hypothetical protein